MEPPGYLFLETVARRAGVSVDTARYWVRIGKLDSVRPGRRRLVPVEAFRRLMEKGRCPRNGQPGVRLQDRRRK